MTRRLDRSWIVFESIENDEHNRCVDLFLRPEGTYGFEEFSRDPEDGGAWTPVGYFSGASFPSKDAALAEAVRAVAWLDAATQSRGIR